jgi:hypothetical protein
MRDLLWSERRRIAHAAERGGLRTEAIGHDRGQLAAQLSDIHQQVDAQLSDIHYQVDRLRVPIQDLTPVHFTVDAQPCDIHYQVDASHRDQGQSAAIAREAIRSSRASA